MDREREFVFAVMVGEQNLRSPYVRSLLQTARHHGIAAFQFTPSDVLGGGSVGGAALIPWPSVVYNRVPTRRDEVSAGVQRVKRIFRREGIPYFNERFFNKREVDRVLRENGATVDLLPDTLADGADDSAIEGMLERYQELFLKPIAGSFGEGICRLVKVNGQYRVDSRQSHGLYSRHFKAVADAVHACRQYMDQMPFIVQEAVPLATYADRKTDFRVHIHRLDADAWEVVAVAAKVARKDAVTTHVHSGGQIEDAAVVLRDWFGQRSTTVGEEIAEKAIRVGRKLTSDLDANLGELGLDMGIAVDGRIVLFEANAKPGRIIFTHRSMRKAGQVSRQRVVQYAEYLSRWKMVQGVEALAGDEHG